jgi:hypothetical protein
MQRINVAILNGWFGICCGGALVFSVLDTADPVIHSALTSPGSAASTALRRSVTRAETACGSGIRTP